VRGACELLGLDPLFVANEGKLVAFVHPDSAAAVLKAMQDTPQGKESAIIGRTVAGHPGMVVLKTEVGGTRIVDLPFNEQLPRIC
ncbi:MAG: AIR synthase-related protein, partial [Thermoanaerobaculia bacterium]